MRIKLRLHGQIKAAIGSREIELEVREGARLRDLPTLLASRYGQEIATLLGGEEPFRSLRVLINGRDHFTLKGVETRFAEGDVVSLVPPIVGG